MIASPQTRTNPFPGLRPFEADEDHLFFGREGQTDELLRRLRSHRFLAVVGTSGSGKSSLVRAGLLPALYSGFMAGVGSSWRVALLRPGNAPIANLAVALNHPDVLGLVGEEARLQTIITETVLRRGGLGLVEAVQQARLPADENLLVVVDQFEELFRFKKDAHQTDSGDEAAAFVKLLLEAAGQMTQPIYVVLTMRSDFLGDCAQFRDLPEAMNDSQYLTPRLTRDQLQQAIAAPVAVGGATIAPRLVSRLLNDVGDNPDQLPILQHALMRTWDNWTADHQANEPLDLRHYEAIRTMAEALSQHGDEIYDGLPDRLGEVAERLFKCLTEKGVDGRGIRRPTLLQEGGAIAGATEAEVIAVVEAFRAGGCSFLTPPLSVPLAADSMVDLSHESLMRVWERLKLWVEDESHSAGIYRRLAESARLYEAGKTGLWRDPELAHGLRWRREKQPNQAWAAQYAPRFEAAIQFLEASVVERDRLEKEKEDRRRREIRTAWGIAIGSLVAVVVSSSLGLFAWNKSNEAELSQANALGRYSQALLSKGKELEAFVQAIKAGKHLQNQDATDPEVMGALLGTIYEGNERNRLEGHESVVYSVSFSPDGKTLASGSYDNTIKLWNVETGKEIRSLKGHKGEVISVSFSPDGKTLASGSLDKTIKLWNVKTGKEIRSLKGHEGGVYSVSFGPDGKTLASGSEDKTIKLWNVETSKEIRSLKGHEGGVYSVSFSPNGKTLASGSEDKTIKLWTVETGKEIRSLKGHKGKVSSVSFSPDGKTLASGSLDNTIKLWNVETGKEIYSLKGHKGGVHSVSFSPDGKTLASGSADRTIKLWNVETGVEIRSLKGHESSVYSVSFSPDGKNLASGSYYGTIKLWNVETGEEIRSLKGHEDRVSSVSFSPDGKTLASGSYDRTIKLWNVETGREIRSLKGHEGEVSSVSFSPDGKTLASGSADNTIKLWNVETGTEKIGKEIRTLKGHEDRVSSVSFSPDGKTLASGSTDKTIKLWNVDLDFLVGRSCDWVRNYLANNPNVSKSDRSLCDGVGAGK
jgi:WD40 repeat protein